MLKDRELIAAVSRISQRAERLDDIQKLRTYVDVGLLPQLENKNNQIFYGRRGTGKTHVMKVLETRFKDQPSNTVVYVDCRTLGSTSQFSDTSLPIGHRCLALFRDLLGAIYHSLREHICDEPSSSAVEAHRQLDDLNELITEPLRVFKAEKLSIKEQASRETQAASKVGLDPFRAALNVSGSMTRSASEESHTQFDVELKHKIIFPQLHGALKRILRLAETTLFILIDEWSSLPLDIQPYFAEFIKRGLLPVSTVTMKICALEHRCRFSKSEGATMIGFALGADIASAPDLDDYFVFDRNPDKITDVYADVLLRHLSSELPAQYLSSKYHIQTPKEFATRMFTERNTCAELARACEGVIRDLINIFSQAVFNAQRRDRQSIDKKAILESSRIWFEQDKARYLDDHLQHVLRRIVDEVIGQKRARSFLLPRELERHPVVQRLFDARVLHHMQRGYADKDNPGIRYNIYAIDYGADVDLLGTSKEPQLDLEPSREGVDIAVPFDDKRSIRRIVLNATVLD